MADIIKPEFGPRPRETATCTHEVGRDEELRRRVLERSDNLRPAKRLPADLVDGDALERLGMGRGIPHARDDARRRELRELRQRVDSMAEAAGSLEIAARLLRTEAETISRRLAQMGGEGGSEPQGAA